MSSNLKRKKMQEEYDSTEDLILKDEKSFTPSNGSLTPELNYVVEVPSVSHTKIWKYINKCLVIVVVILLILCLIFVCLYMHASHQLQTSEKYSKKYCTSSSCIEAAAFIKSSMEETINPCDDFYLYSCGGWLQNNPIPDGKNVWAVDSNLGDKILHKLKRILDNSTKAKKFVNRTSISNVYKFYRTCKDQKSINKLGGKPLIDMLNRIGTFQRDDGKKDVFKKSELTKVLIKYYNEAHASSFFSIGMSVDDKNSTNYILKLSQKGLGLALFRYKNETDPILGTYVKYVSDIIELLNYTKLTGDEIYQLSKECFEIEKKLAKIFVPPENLTTVSEYYHKLTIAQVQEKVPSVDWLAYVNNKLKVVNITVTQNEPILVNTLGYFNKLGVIISKIPKRIFQNYLLFRTARFYASFLTNDFIELHKPLSIALHGVYEELPRWKRCMYATESRFGMVLSSLYVEKEFTADSYREANEMVENIRKGFVAGFSNLKWMDDKTREAATDKADSIYQKIGYPEYILNHDKLDEDFQGLEFDGGYFENDLILDRYKSVKRWKLFRKPVDRSLWEMNPISVNAYYNPSANQIVFPAAILQPPFFKYGYPKAVNYGRMGAIIGHEITHGFDDDGRQYDKHGNFRPWWTDESVKGFNKLKKCFVDEYSQFEHTDLHLHLKGNVTLGENLADNGGLKAAYRAYKAWVKKNGDEPLLPGIAKSNDETFFIAFGQAWCTDELSSRLVSQINIDVHSPPIDRVRGSIQNNEDFARIFKCPVGSHMNPKKRKCSIW